MVACLSFAVPLWMRNGYRIPRKEIDNRANISQAPGKKEVCSSVYVNFVHITLISAQPHHTMFLLKKKGSPVDVAPACAGSEEGSWEGSVFVFFCLVFYCLFLLF
jgi:hypothetical protein